MLAGVAWRPPTNGKTAAVEPMIADHLGRAWGWTPPRRWCVDLALNASTRAPLAQGMRRLRGSSM